MKEYIKPYIEDENIELEDIIAVSGDPIDDWNPLDPDDPDKIEI